MLESKVINPVLALNMNSIICTSSKKVQFQGVGPSYTSSKINGSTFIDIILIALLRYIVPKLLELFVTDFQSENVNMLRNTENKNSALLNSNDTGYLILPISCETKNL